MYLVKQGRIFLQLAKIREILWYSMLVRVWRRGHWVYCCWNIYSSIFGRQHGNRFWKPYKMRLPCDATILPLPQWNKDMFKHSAPRMLVITLISEELETNVPKLDMWHSYIIKCVKNDIVTYVRCERMFKMYGWMKGGLLYSGVCSVSSFSKKNHLSTQICFGRQRD